MNKIGIIGLGYVGLPLAVEFARAGFFVLGFDKDINKVESINCGKSYIKHISSESIIAAKDRFTATNDFSKLSDVDYIIICVPTPLNEYGQPDLSYVLSAGETIAKYMKRGQTIVLESTTYPGTTDEDLKAVLEKSGLKAGIDFYLAFSPEREDPGNKVFTTKMIPKVIGGYTESCLSKVVEVYRQVFETVVPVSSTRVAEAAKLLENIYRAVNISLVNELKMLFDRMDIDIWEVIDAASTKPFGFHAFYPGPGVGGHCIPVDPFYLVWKAKEYDFNPRFINIAGEINISMPYYVVEKITEALNSVKKAINGSNILILGVAYKKDIDDLRESPAIAIVKRLLEKGACVDFHDPYVNELNIKSVNYYKRSKALTDKTLGEYDCVVIITDHSFYDPEVIYNNSNLIVDTRNMIKIKSQKVVKA
ncbi:nucleotide sugar dehydrogenase [Spirochaetia bacterium 38H-sp]|uniref:Nucleotide sugar dehydrogenase n=1 Tax=Rarispira pelagica TaxID=3141764 RepID=A0ABU9UAI4_9SPIR